VLDQTCTDAFFEGASPPSACRYLSGSTVNDNLGLATRQNFEVTIQGDLDSAISGSNLVCWDDTDGRFYEHDPAGGSDCANAGDDDDLFAIGSTPPQANDAAMTASRSVSLANQDMTLEVTMW
jgi:hypothetical protein